MTLQRVRPAALPLVLLVLLAALAAAPASASLAVGDEAPGFTAPASQAGKEFSYSLADQLAKGPVVLYFYPEAFTKGCTMEAHEFAEAIDRFHALGATVVGVSHDDIGKLKRFSVSECRSKFPVVADPDRKIIESYDAALPGHEEYANRTSYVIAPDGKILYVYTDMHPKPHVENTLKAIETWKTDQAGGSR